RLLELEDEKKQKLDRKTNLYSNKEKFEKELAEKEEELASITAKLSNKETEIEEKKKVVQDNIDLRYEILAEINTHDINFENTEKQEKHLKEEIAKTISELDETRLSKEETDKSFYEIENKKNNISNSLKDKSEIKVETSQKLGEFEEKYNDIASKVRMKDSRLKFLIETEKEKEGYSKTVKSLLLDAEKNANLNKGLHGVLASLVSVPKEYQIAIEIALGGALQNIVTDTDSDAKKLVEYLRQNSLGRATFLPISSVTGRKLENITKGKLTGVIGVGTDLIKYDKKYDGIFQNLLGRTVVVDTIDTGIELAKQNKYGFRIVTLKGDVVSSSGAISGGSIATKTVNILGRAGEIEDLEKEIKKLKNELTKISEEKEQYIKNNAIIIEEIEGLEKELQEVQIVYATEKQKVMYIEQNILKLEAKLEHLKEEKESLADAKTKNSTSKEEAKKKIEEIDKQNEELNEQINTYVSINSDNQKYIDDLNFDITNLKVSVSSFDESEVSIDEMVQRIEQDMLLNNQSINNKLSDRQRILEDNKLLEDKIAEVNLKITELKSQVSSSGTDIDEYKNLRISKNADLDKTEIDIKEQLKMIEDVKEQVAKVEIKKSKIELELEQIVNKMWEEYELTPNNAGEYEKPENVAAVTKKVNSIRNEIKDLGSINIDAIEEYKQTKDRYDLMSVQRKDLEETIAKLNKVIQDMVSVMKEQFEKQFKIINANFDEVFRELFGGGKAELSLSDKDNVLESGIDIQVQPPGKKLQNMMLLSGGERAFTAIALLFAILKINPAPFCILDEIEAALDDVNVYRFAEYLKKFSKQTQFLIITHRKGTMEAADTVYGVTMEEKGISKLLSLKLK
ncbi:MAG: chromosome segregation protein SMC, partial [Lachnospiraceae bacterium]|nr:chromosome segregation protein SMC [Lachnospiraceae bacterium]